MTSPNTEIIWQTASIPDRVRLFETIYLNSKSNSIQSRQSIQPQTQQNLIPTNPQLQSYLLKLVSQRKATLQQFIEATGIHLTDISNSAIDSTGHQYCVSLTTTVCVGLICCASGYAMASYLRR